LNTPPQPKHAPKREPNPAEGRRAIGASPGKHKKPAM